jgi:nucleoside 2-deoxyribosyltransferase/sugar/nucleoside kinase (ribokinase family)
LSESTICLIGQAIVDTTLATSDSPIKMRLGGVVHAARALWALDATYGVGFIAPTYLEAEVHEYLTAIDARMTILVGVVNGAPNVMLIAHAEEAGSQGYEFLLRDRHQVSLEDAALRQLFETLAPTDILLFPDSSYFDALARQLPTSGVRVYIDADLDVRKLAESHLSEPIAALMLSTSSDVFRVTYEASVLALRTAVLEGPVEALLFKENRGGSRLFTRDGSYLQTPAHVRSIIHSVGVGDVFDAAFCVLRQRHDDRVALAYASAMAADYATTTYPDEFKRSVQATLSISPEEIVTLSGVVVPWDVRGAISIYVAAPDFDYIDRRPLERLVEALEYHGFAPRRPVKENGQLTPDASNADRLRAAQADLALLDRCQILVAVLLYDDPGTLVEVGIALERRLPVIVYDPYQRVTNPMLTQTAVVVTALLDEAISAVFEQVGRLQ